MCVCVCVCTRARVCVCLCKVMRERRGGGGGGGVVQMLEFDGQSTLTSSVAIISNPSTIPPLNHHPHLPSWRPRMVAGVRFQQPSAGRHRAFEL